MLGLKALSSQVQAIAMSFMVNVMGSNTLGSGAMTGFMLWPGFIVPTYLVNKLFAGHGLKIWGIEVGNHLVNFLIFGALLAV
ncbi:MAG: hypothetical protein OHK003_05060 [Anaerolineales bacterium]